MTSQFKNTEIIDTGFLRLPRGTTNQRPSSPEAGQIRFNTDLGKPEWYEPEYGVWLTTDRQPPVVASGGDTVEDVDIDGVTYRIHSFTSVGSSTFTVTRGGLVDYLIVAGGGSGGSFGGGGGAGGFLTGLTTIATRNYTITVGAGGDAVSSGSTFGNNGGNSSAFGINAIGGGGGGNNGSGNENHTGRSGGSGGGSSTQNATAGRGGKGTPGQGNKGGSATGGDTSGLRKSRGGGGAGFPALDGDGSEVGAGGDGVNSAITGTLKFYAGGGGGHNWDNSDIPPGGLGGGGNGGPADSSGDPGDANTGGGGGGGDTSRASGSGAGGSGIVIIRYRIS